MVKEKKSKSSTEIFCPILCKMLLLLQSDFHVGEINLRLDHTEKYYQVTCNQVGLEMRKRKEKWRTVSPRNITFMSCRNYLKDDWAEEAQKKSMEYTAFLSQKKTTLKPAEIYPHCVVNFPKAHSNEKHFILPQICQQWDLGGYCPPHSTAEASAQWVSFSIISQTFATSVQIEATKKWKVCIL